MRNTIIAIVVAVTAVFGLTACTSSTTDEITPAPEYKSELVFINPDNGKITKFMDDNGEVIFEENYTEEDTRLAYSSYAYTNREQLTLSSAIEIDGSPYPVDTTAEWFWSGSMDTGEQIALYNEHLADPGYATMPPGMFHIPSIFQDALRTTLQESIDAHTFPAPSFTTTGRSFAAADQRIVAGWESGAPAWQVLQEVSGQKVSEETFYYSFFCAEYDVVLENEQQLIEAIKALDVTHNRKVSLFISKPSVLIETNQPCTIEKAVPPAFSNGSFTDGRENPTPRTKNPKVDPQTSGDIIYFD